MGRRIINREDIDTLMRNIRIDPASECWEWIGNTTGRGMIQVAGRLWLAHRFSWALHHRAAPDAPLRPPAKFIMRRCDNSSCVNPAHLYAGDHRASHANAIARGRFDPMALSRHSRKRRIRKLTDDQVREIRAGRETTTALAARFGVARNTITEIRARRAKTLVPD